MKTIAIVPMKLNSERLPNKNIKAFDNGEPLCYYILRTLLTVNGIDEIYVYCSNDAIKKYLPAGIRFLKRSKNLDSNETKINEVLYSFAKEVPADIYVMAHTTAPFIKASSIQIGLNAVLSQKYDSAFSVKKIKTFLWKDGVPFNYSLNNIPRTQDLPSFFAETSSFYIYKKSIIMDLNRRIGDMPYMVEVGEVESIDIDEKEDFDIANAVFNFLRGCK